MKELKSYIFESSNDDSKIVFRKSVFNDFFNNKQFEITINGEKINIINITFDRKTERGNELFRFNYDIESQIPENTKYDAYQITCGIIKYIFDTIFGENNWNDFFKLGSPDTYSVKGRIEGTSGLYKTLPIKNNDTTQDSVCLYYENNEFKTEPKSKKAKKILYIPLNKFNNLYIANQHDAYYGNITIGRKKVTPNKTLNLNKITLNNLKNIDNIFNSKPDKCISFCKNYLTNFINKLQLLNFNKIIEIDKDNNITINKNELSKIEITVEKEHFIFNDESNNFILSDKDLDNFFNDFGEVLNGVFMLFCFEKDDALLEFPEGGNNPFADFYIYIDETKTTYSFSAKHDDGAACSIKNFTQKSSEDQQSLDKNTEDIFDIFNNEKNSVIDTIIQLANFYKDKTNVQDKKQNDAANTLTDLSKYMLNPENNTNNINNKKNVDVEFTEELFTKFREKIREEYNKTNDSNILNTYFEKLNYTPKRGLNKINYNKNDFLLYPLKSFLCTVLNKDESFIKPIRGNCKNLAKHYQIYIKHKNNSYNTLKFEIIDLTESDTYNINIVNGGDINNVNNQSFRLKFKPN